MRQHEKNAMAVAKYLESSPCVEEVFYPGRCVLVDVRELDNWVEFDITKTIPIARISR